MYIEITQKTTDKSYFKHSIANKWGIFLDKLNNIFQKMFINSTKF